MLVLAAHGTRDPAGVVEVDRMADALRERLPSVPVRVAYADVRQPNVTEVLAEVTGPAVVVPAFLASGYHVRVDLPAQISASGRQDVVLTTPLGPDPGLVTAVHERLAQAGWRPGDSVVLAAAGSSDARALSDVDTAAQLLAERIGAAVPVGYVSTARPKVGEVVAACREQRPGARVALATWLLAPGVFHTSLAEAGADLVAAPIGAHPSLINTVASRYRLATGSVPVDHS
ncbi:sirohydrochlorin chelatase [Goodfellowiella coeruleoviolacea]|uniref:Sirohydrochlorin ferrochelatase n=1 Tax=Goodfellowiella coeruleoviolacea TaxID=334858 RepID=A0AAE3GIJ9_9PSEU|nr:sirohydrochlorin chelatase [Goodfellowiella coeruleoviolacea]MCP2168820.1 Sirohydrochlorin ferrochelatase [Goodfellowiella coeruleoviolacea]